jgi:hypothetical protein
MSRHDRTEILGSIAFLFLLFFAILIFLSL